MSRITRRRTSAAPFVPFGLSPLSSRLQGAPPARQAPGRWPGLMQEPRGHRPGDALLRWAPPPGPKRGAGGAAVRLRGDGHVAPPSGGSPAGRAAARSGCPASAGRRSPPQRRAGASRQLDRGWPVLRAWHPLTAQDHSQRRSLRSRPSLPSCREAPAPRRSRRITLSITARACAGCEL